MDNKKIVALSDDALDSVAGGMIVNSNHVINQETGEKYTLLKSQMEAFSFLIELGDMSESERVSQLRAAGFIA